MILLLLGRVSPRVGDLHSSCVGQWLREVAVQLIQIEALTIRWELGGTHFAAQVSSAQKMGLPGLEWQPYVAVIAPCTAVEPRLGGC